jgi:glucose-1-phosphatase
MNKIKAYLFDFGAVLYDIEPVRTIQALANLSSDGDFLKNIELDELFHNTLFLEYEQGRISTIEFRKNIRELFKIGAFPDEAVDLAWNQTLIGPFDDAFELVSEFKSSGKLYLLSNTNELHQNYFGKECKDLLNLFEHCFYSFEMNMRKPQPEIYRAVLKSIGFRPKEILFIDDSVLNIEAAKALGINVYHITPDTKLSDLLHTVK